MWLWLNIVIVDFGGFWHYSDWAQCFILSFITRIISHVDINYNKSPVCPDSLCLSVKKSSFSKSLDLKFFASKFYLAKFKFLNDMQMFVWDAFYFVSWMRRQKATHKKLHIKWVFLSSMTFVSAHFKCMVTKQNFYSCQKDSGENKMNNEQNVHSQHTKNLCIKWISKVHLYWRCGVDFNRKFRLRISLNTLYCCVIIQTFIRFCTE